MKFNQILFIIVNSNRLLSDRLNILMKRTEVYLESIFSCLSRLKYLYLERDNHFWHTGLKSLQVGTVLMFLKQKTIQKTVLDLLIKKYK